MIKVVCGSCGREQKVGSVGVRRWMLVPHGVEVTAICGRRDGGEHDLCLVEFEKKVVPREKWGEIVVFLPRMGIPKVNLVAGVE